jgi:O-methyltransferase involved in polyketide biosynthesis
MLIICIVIYFTLNGFYKKLKGFFMAGNEENQVTSISALGVYLGTMRAMRMHPAYLDALGLQYQSYCDAMVQSIIDGMVYGSTALQLKVKGITALPDSAQADLFHKLYLPYYDEVVATRKIMLKDTIESAIEDGVTQVLFLGGGFDPKALCMATSNSNTHVNFLEVDFGKTFELKKDAIVRFVIGDGLEKAYSLKRDAGSIGINENYTLVESDVCSDSLVDTLNRTGFDKHKKSLIILEGVTAYLTAEQNAHLLKKLQLLISDESRLIIDYLPRLPNTPDLKNAHQQGQEAHKFTALPADALALLNSNGFKVDSCVSDISVRNMMFAMARELYTSKEGSLNVFYNAKPCNEKNLKQSFVDIPESDLLRFKYNSHLQGPSADPTHQGDSFLTAFQLSVAETNKVIAKDAKETAASIEQSVKKLFGV